MTNEKSYVNMALHTTALSAGPLSKEVSLMDQQEITILYRYLSDKDALDRE